MAKREKNRAQQGEVDRDGTQEVEVISSGPTKAIEIEYNEHSAGWTVYQCIDGERQHPPLIWHEAEFDDCLKRLAQEYKKRVVLTIELRDV